MPGGKTIWILLCPSPICPIFIACPDIIAWLVFISTVCNALPIWKRSFTCSGEYSLNMNVGISLSKTTIHVVSIKLSSSGGHGSGSSGQGLSSSSSLQPHVTIISPLCSILRLGKSSHNLLIPNCSKVCLSCGMKARPLLSMPDLPEYKSWRSSKSGVFSRLASKALRTTGLTNIFL